MSEFCVKCSEKDAAIELLHKKCYEEIEIMKARITKLEDENEALIMDVAFYGGNIVNLSCNDK